MNLKQLLQHSKLSNINVVNQDADLNRPVDTVVMMDAPDIADFIMANQLLVTTGYHFVNNISGFIDLINVLGNKNAAAIGIKDHRFLKSLPDEVIEAANDQHLPILLLPSTTRLSVLVQDIIHILLEPQTERLRRIMNDTLNISKFILAHKSDNEILDEMAKLLHCDLFIVNVFGRLTAKNHDAKVDPKLLDYTNHQIILIDLDHPITIANQYLMYPLKNANKLMRRFVIFKMHKITDSGQSLLIENMVNLLSLESMQVGINISEDRKRRSEIFETILSQNIPESAFADSLKVNGLKTNDQYQAFAIDEANSIDAGLHQSMMHQVADYVYWYFDKVNIPIVAINWNFKLFVLVKTKHSLLPILLDLHQFLKQNFPRLQIMIGFTSYLKQLIHFNKLLDEADDALLIAKRKQMDKPNSFTPQHVNDILSLIPKNEALMFINAVLGPLLNIKEEEKKQLIEFLERYFANNQSISQAANDLFIHRNTAVYRLKKIEKLLNLDLKQVKDNDNLRLATRLYLIYF